MMSCGWIKYSNEKLFYFHGGDVCVRNFCGGRSVVATRRRPAADSSGFAAQNVLDRLGLFRTDAGSAFETVHRVVEERRFYVDRASRRNPMGNDRAVSIHFARRQKIGGAI